MANNQWWELRTIGEPALDDPLSWELQAVGCQGTSSQLRDGQLHLCAYFPHSQVTETELATIAAQLRQAAAQADLTVADITWTSLTEEDWASSWKAYWHPTPVGDRLLIHPDWLPLDPTQRIVIRLNPGVAFGTGAHATTQLCLAALEQQLVEPMNHPYTVADIGCGTGILAIAALLLGADQAYAVDTDPLAVQAAQECRDLNGLEASRMQVAEGSMAEAIALMNAPADGFCCNIFAHVIIELIPYMTQLVKPEGWGILSGMLERQVPEVTAALNAQGWQVTQHWQQEDWACLKVVRSEG